MILLKHNQSENKFVPMLGLWYNTIFFSITLSLIKCILVVVFWKRYMQKDVQHSRQGEALLRRETPIHFGFHK